jgi:hypothetical protein
MGGESPGKGIAQSAPVTSAVQERNDRTIIRMIPAEWRRFRPSSSPQPEHHKAENRADETDRAQPLIRRVHHDGDRPLGGLGESRENKPLDNEDEPESGQEIGHRMAGRGPAAYLGVALPSGSPKYLKKSESGRSTSRVSLARSPVS